MTPVHACVCVCAWKVQFCEWKGQKFELILHESSHSSDKFNSTAVREQIWTYPALQITSILDTFKQFWNPKALILIRLGLYATWHFWVFLTKGLSHETQWKNRKSQSGSKLCYHAWPYLTDHPCWPFSLFVRSTQGTYTHTLQHTLSLSLPPSISLTHTQTHKHGHMLTHTCTLAHVALRVWKIKNILFSKALLLLLLGAKIDNSNTA